MGTALKILPSLLKLTPQNLKFLVFNGSLFGLSGFVPRCYDV